MKKLISIRVSTFIAILALLSLHSCVKSNLNTSESGALGFNYGGHSYSVADGNFSFNNGVLSFKIDRPANVPGTVYFSGNCAYFTPADSASNMMVASGCKISSNLSPIDSSVIYVYKSGTLTSNTGNCHTESGTDLFTGRPISTTYCNVNGEFDLVLKNSRNETMTFTTGKFHISNQSH